MKARSIVGALVLGVTPVALAVGLEEWLVGSGAAGVMLGAVAGASELAVLGTLAALLLRVYCVVVLPGVLAYALVVSVGGLRPPTPPRGSLRRSESASARPDPPGTHPTERSP